MIPVQFRDDKWKWNPLYSRVSSGSTNVWFLETQALEDLSVREIKVFWRGAPEDVVPREMTREDVIVGYRQALPSENLTVAVKRMPQWEELGECSNETDALEPLSESFWIFIGEVLKKLEKIIPDHVHIYTLSDGAFVLDAILDGGRAACILRRRYAHLMVLAGDKMADVVLRGDDATPARIQSELRAALA
jgi:hypothetical protein